ncbi:MAG: sigma-70 family RNA polymerase sigma factor [Phycisphaerales bacterium]|nr:sigma-70 family RNA polymerase sigma factor [Phycisphaerales bacterium]
MPESTSVELLTRLLGGHDELAWREFVDRYAPFLSAAACKIGLRTTDAADAVQETLIAVYRRFEQSQNPWDPTKGRFRSWLRRVLKNKVIDIQKRLGLAAQRLALAGRAQGGTIAVEELASDDEEKIERILDEEWRMNLLRRARQALRREFSPETLMAFDAVTAGGQSPAATARLLGMSRNAVDIAKWRVLRRLRQVVHEIEQDEERV